MVHNPVSSNVNFSKMGLTIISSRPTAKDLSEYSPINLMLVRVINGANSIFEVDLLILLSHDAMSAEEYKAAPINHKI